MAASTPSSATSSNGASNEDGNVGLFGSGAAVEVVLLNSATVAAIMEIKLVRTPSTRPPQRYLGWERGCQTSIAMNGMFMVGECDVTKAGMRYFGHNALGRTKPVCID